MSDVRPCERLCPKCGQWKHHSRFRSQRLVRHGSVSITFRQLCKDCEQIIRNEHKNADRALDIMQRRTEHHARELGVKKRFLWVNMNWQALVPVLRAMMGPDGRCLDCGHQFLNERDIQIEHREPPRHPQDWARQHTRSVGLACASCNNGKGTKPFAIWLDEQEDARLANERHRNETSLITPSAPIQMTLDEMLA